MMRDALIIVDMQEDFMPWGSLPVKDADSIIPKINEYIEFFRSRGGLIVATRDWHPPDHISFKSQGGPWPEHCVQNTTGANFVKGLRLPPDTLIISKADKPDQEAYSGFQGTQLKDKLLEFGVKNVFICGVATEYCVKSTAIDAVRNGFRTYLLVDAIKAVSDPTETLTQLRQMGIIMIDDIEYLKEGKFDEKI